jgi:uncharacterized protein YndB with AHSA1/START domain
VQRHTREIAFVETAKERASVSEHTGIEIESSLHSDGAKGLIRLKAVYGSNRDAVWSAITDPEQLALWYGRVEGDLREGGDFSAFIYGSEWDGRGHIHTCLPLRELSITESEEDGPEVTVIARLAPDGERTTFDVEVSGLPPEMLFAFGAGWHTQLERLGEYLAGSGPKDLSTSWLERWDELAPSYREKLVVPID